MNIKQLRENKKGVSKSETDLSPFVARPGFQGVFSARRGIYLKISIHCELKLTYKYFFEWADVCLLVKYQHGLFIFNRINGSK